MSLSVYQRCDDVDDDNNDDGGGVGVLSFSRYYLPMQIYAGTST